MKKVMLILIVVMLVLSGCSSSGVSPMAIDFNTVNDQRINFGTMTSLQALQTKTIIIRVNIQSTTQGDFLGMWGTAGTDEDWSVSIDPNAKLYFEPNFNTKNGIWYSTNTLTTGEHSIALTYDYGAVTNNPLAYLDGASLALTKFQEPIGTYVVGTSTSFRIGSYFTGFPPVDCIIRSVLIYNRIISATEIANIHNSRMRVYSRNGLVFSPNPLGAIGAALNFPNIGE